MGASSEANSISYKFLQIGSLFSRLHPNAVLSGNLIQISGIPQEACRSIQRLVLRGDLNWAKHLKVSIDLGHPSKKKSTLVFQVQSASKCHWKYKNSSPHSRRSYKEKCGAKGPQTASILRMYDTENISLPQPDQQVLTSNPLPQPPISSRFSNFSQ